MNKLQAIRAAVDELDAAKLAWDEREAPQLASITDAQYNRHHVAMANVDWEAIARQLLPFAEAAEAVLNTHTPHDLRIGFLQVFEADNMYYTAQEFQKHIDAMEKLDEALKGLDE